MKLLLNPLLELVPEFMIANRNHTAKGAWHSNHCPAPLGCSKGNTTAVGRATTEDIRTGWAGHKTEREQKEIYFGLETSAPALLVETNREQLFNLQWSRCWQLRALKGWTPLASLDLDLHGEETRAEHEGWAIGCPKWYADHPPS